MKPGQGPPSANTSANTTEPRTTASNMILVFTDCPFDWLLRTARPGDACCSPRIGRCYLLLRLRQKR